MFHLHSFLCSEHQSLQPLRKAFWLNKSSLLNIFGCKAIFKINLEKCKEKKTLINIFWCFDFQALKKFPNCRANPWNTTSVKTILQSWYSQTISCPTKVWTAAVNELSRVKTMHCSAPPVYTCSHKVSRTKFLSLSVKQRHAVPVVERGKFHLQVSPDFWARQ